MFPAQITVHNIAQLNAVMAALGVDAKIPTQEVAAAPVEKPAKAAKSTPAATQQSPAPTQPTAEVAVDAAPEKTVEEPAQPAASVEAAPQASTAATEVTYQDAAAAITKLSRTKGRDAAVNLLKTFGAAKLPDVKPEQFADVIAAAEAAIGE